MAVITTLDVVNACLDTMGESPLNALDADHPYVASALNALKSASTQEQGIGWWFNQDTIELPLDPNTGVCYFPGDVTSLDTGDPRITQRGRRLYDRANGTFDLRIIAPNGVFAFVTREIPFEDLPALAQQVIQARTKLDFQNSFDGDANKYNKLAQIHQRLFMLLKAEHIRNSKPNFLNAPSVQQKMRHIRPMTRHV